MPEPKPVSIITGASSGLGVEFARLFAKDGKNIALVARTKSKLDALANELGTQYGVETCVIDCDLSDPAAPGIVFARIKENLYWPEALVNNAGFGNYGPFSDSPLQKELQMLQLNIVTLTHLTKLALREMQAHKKGAILNVASTAAFQPGPLMAVYYASKAYVLSFTEALASELKGTPIKVSALCPGPTKTGFQEEADMGKSELFKSMVVMDAKPVAIAGYEGLKEGKRIVVPGLANKVLSNSARIMPRNLLTETIKFVQRPSS